MKKIKKMLALVLAMALVLGAMTIPAMAEVTQPDGSITINSPIVEAEYTAYKVFDMTTNAAGNSFSYTISSDNPFFETVMAYANMPAQLPDADADGLTLTVSADTAGAAVKVYNVSVTDDFDPQAFGQALLTALQGKPAVEADPNADPPVEAQPAVGPIDASDVAETPIKVTADNADQIKWENLDLGYFLITAEYPGAEFGSVKMTDGKDNVHTFDKTALVDPEATDLELTQDALDDIDVYVENTVDDDYIQNYIDTNNLKDKDAAGNAIAIVKGSDRWNEIEQELIDSLTEDAQNKVLGALKNQIEGSESDINLAHEPILVFLDSSKPDAVINEKNETDKWDVPVNPSGDALPEDLPDHGEPKGGKNIVINEDPAVYADWSEAAIGDSVHYQLRVNAMNFIRTGDTDDTVEQVKEYFLADYQSGHMVFDEDKGLKVTVYEGDDDNNSQQATLVNVTKDKDGHDVEFLDYTNQADVFFKNTTTSDANPKPTDIFGTGTGIMVPWVIVSEKNADLDPDYPIYTTTKVPTGEYQEASAADIANHVPTVEEGGKYYLLDEDNQKIPLYDTYYVYSMYNSDVTIVVDYYMILQDNAVVDEPGNKNYAQYGWSPVDNTTGGANPQPKPPTPPTDGDKPSQKEEVDEATVYTFAIAWVKVDEKANQLAGAKFQLPFYVKEAKDGDAYVYGGTTAGDGLTNEVETTTTSAVITIKGLEEGVYSITETEAPEGYNKLASPFDVEAKKTGEGETVKTKTTIYLDEKGNVTETVTTTTKEYNTDPDSYNKEGAADGEETSVPVYQFDPVVNKKGAELPSTGGIGTTIFYVMGSILVICAGVVLVTRRRMAA